jgi:coatomer subunit beta'
MFPDLSLLLSGSEDENVKVWHSSTFNLECTLTLDSKRCWTMASLPGNSRIALGFDQGMLIIEVSRKEQKE